MEQYKDIKCNNLVYIHKHINKGEKSTSRNKLDQIARINIFNKKYHKNLNLNNIMNNDKKNNFVENKLNIFLSNDDIVNNIINTNKSNLYDFNNNDIHGINTKFYNINNINNIDNNINYDYEYNEEKKLKDHGKSINLNELKRISNQMENCVCKIKKNGKEGTGFFCKIPIEEDTSLPVLITNNHVLNENDIKPNNNIDISINDDKNPKVIYIKDSKNTYTMEKPYDITFIEIKEYDKINSESYLEIDDIFNEDSYQKYSQKSIYLIHYPNKVVEFSTGVIKSISEDDNHTIQHFCETELGSSGSPIINLTNNKVIGIHKGSADKNFNLGTFLKTPIEKFKEEIKNKKKKNVFFENKIILSDDIIPKLSAEKMEIIMKQMKECVCRIFSQFERKGTGFFCYIPFKGNSKFPVLITCNHILSKEDLLPGNTIKLSINENKIFKEIIIDNSRKIYTREEYDITIIEIKSEDKINSDSFLEVDQNMFIKSQDLGNYYRDTAIYLIMYNDNYLSNCVGKIKNIDNYGLEMRYTTTTGSGSSGSPIINLGNHKVIGVHIGSIRPFNYKKGILVKNPINKFESNIKY